MNSLPGRESFLMHAPLVSLISASRHRKRTAWHARRSIAVSCLAALALCSLVPQVCGSAPASAAASLPVASPKSAPAATSIPTPAPTPSPNGHDAPPAQSSLPAPNCSSPQTPMLTPASTAILVTLASDSAWRPIGGQAHLILTGKGVAPLTLSYWVCFGWHVEDVAKEKFIAAEPAQVTDIDKDGDVHLAATVPPMDKAAAQLGEVIDSQGRHSPSGNNEQRRVGPRCDSEHRNHHCDDGPHSHHGDHRVGTTRPAPVHQSESIDQTQFPPPRHHNRERVCESFAVPNHGVDLGNRCQCGLCHGSVGQPHRHHVEDPHFAWHYRGHRHRLEAAKRPSRSSCSEHGRDRSGGPSPGADCSRAS